MTSIVVEAAQTIVEPAVEGSCDLLAKRAQFHNNSQGQRAGGMGMFAAAPNREKGDETAKQVEQLLANVQAQVNSIINKLQTQTASTTAKSVSTVRAGNQ